MASKSLRAVLRDAWVHYYEGHDDPEMLLEDIMLTVLTWRTVVEEGEKKGSTVLRDQKELV
jgi:hypothetical protein